MCDYSLQSIRSRSARVGDKLVTRDFGTGTRGFAAADELELAVCVMPGTELAFAQDIACLPSGLLGWNKKTTNYRTAIFRQINKDKMRAHHDALEFPDGRTELLTLLCPGQAARSSAAGAVNDRYRDRCPEARRLRGLTIRDRSICVGCLMKAAYFFQAQPLNNQTPDRISERPPRGGLFVVAPKIKKRGLADV